jgi:hypothetical protein
MVAMLVFFLRVLYEDEDEDEDEEAVEVVGEEALEEVRGRFLLLRLLETCFFLSFLLVSKTLSGSNSSGSNIQDIVSDVSVSVIPLRELKQSTNSRCSQGALRSRVLATPTESTCASVVKRL